MKMTLMCLMFMISSGCKTTGTGSDVSDADTQTGWKPKNSFFAGCTGYGYSFSLSLEPNGASAPGEISVTDEDGKSVTEKVTLLQQRLNGDGVKIFEAKSDTLKIVFPQRWYRKTFARLNKIDSENGWELKEVVNSTAAGSENYTWDFCQAETKN